MAVYRCRFCGSMYDEEKEGVPVGELKVCPVCRVAADKLVRVDDVGDAGETVSGAAAPKAGTAAVSGDVYKRQRCGSGWGRRFTKPTRW